MIKQQTGSALIIALLVLLIMTMLGITAMGTSTFEERMAANDRNHKIVFQDAETTLIEAEQRVLELGYYGIGGIYELAATSSPGFFSLDNNINDHLNHTWQPGVNCVAGTATPNSCYTVEIYQEPAPYEQRGHESVPSENAHVILRITVRGSDANGNSTALLQSNVQKNI